MEILKLITSEAERKGARFVVIGGHALNAHGVSRATGDLDLMVARRDADFWVRLLNSLKYTIFQHTSAFIQSKPPTVAEWAIDLVLVDDSTLEKALKDAVAFDHGVARAPTASPPHLLAMKLHALKANQPQRMQKDLGDVAELLQMLCLPVESDAFKQLALKYANLETYERILKALK